MSKKEDYKKEKEQLEKVGLVVEKRTSNKGVVKGL